MRDSWLRRIWSGLLTSKEKNRQKFGNFDALDKQRQEETGRGIWNLGGHWVLKAFFSCMTTSSAMHLSGKGMQKISLWSVQTSNLIFPGITCSELKSPRKWETAMWNPLYVGKCPSLYYSGQWAGTDIM